MAYTYETLLNDNVQFLQGTQTELNKYLPNSTDVKRGTAQEGAFYLTTDTHRIYIGRKVSSGPDADKVFPEEVSTGIATVVESGELSDAVVSGAAHDGDFYYIKSSNVLAVFESNGSGGGQWVQINSPTNISGVTQTFSDTSGITPAPNNSYTGSAAQEVRLRTSVATSGGSADNDIYFKAGDNVTIKPSSNNLGIEISAANSQSNLKIEPSSASANSSQVILSDNINLDTSVYFEGENDTTVAAKYRYIESSDTAVNSKKTYYSQTGSASSGYAYSAINNPSGNPSTSHYYERENVLTIAGPGINGTNVTNLGAVGATTGTSGFKFEIDVQDGAKNSTRQAILSGTASYLDPTIQYGSSGSAKFFGGVAKLDVYSTAETDAKIQSIVTDSLKSVDALHYKGTVASAAELSQKDNGTVQVGDVWKASASFTYNSEPRRAGDLFIAKGTEYALSSDTAVNSSKTYYTRTGSSIDNYVYTPVAAPTGNPSTSSYYEYTGVIASGQVTWEVVPSGDEPLLEGRVLPTDTSNPYFGLEDINISGSYGDAGVDNQAKRPLWVTFDNTNSTLIKATSVGSTADDFKIRLHHVQATTGTSMTISAPTTATPMLVNASTSAVDTIGNQVLNFKAIQSIEKDAYGHITKIVGKEISLQHNYLTEIKTTHTTTGTMGIITLGAQDHLSICDNVLVSGKINLYSDTLSISATTANAGLALNLVWGSF